MLHWCLGAPPETERVWGGLCSVEASCDFPHSERRELPRRVVGKNSSCNYIPDEIWLSNYKGTTIFFNGKQILEKVHVYPRFFEKSHCHDSTMCPVFLLHDSLLFRKVALSFMYTSSKVLSLVAYALLLPSRK